MSQLPENNSIQDMSAAQVREFLFWLIDTQPPGNYRVTCRTARDAVGLRNRMSKIRANDRGAVIKAAKEAGRFIDEGGPVSLLDQFVFRVVEERVVISLAGFDVEAAKAEFLRENGLSGPKARSSYADAAEVEEPTMADREREERDYANTSLI